MSLFHKKADPIAERDRELKARIAALEGQIRTLHQQVSEERTQPRLRSTAVPNPSTAPPPVPPEPAFEEVHRPFPHAPAEAETTPSHYNELGVRKYDPLATLRRWWAQLRGTPTSNPKLLNYLAAGSVHGLRPLRYEKRIARNRFLALCAFFLVILWGLIYFYLRNR